MTSPFDVRVLGPLAPLRDGFCEELQRLGYSPLSIANQVRVMAHLSRWMVDEQANVGELTPQRASAFLQARREVGYTCWLSERGLAPLLGFLGAEGLLPGQVTPVAEGPLEELLVVYRIFLVEERALAATTVARYGVTARWFLSLCGWSASEVAAVTAEQVYSFVLAECPPRSVGLAKNIVCELRSLLRFLFVTGRVPSDLSPVVPAVAGWRGSALPKALDATVVAQLLASCDRGTATGRRDRAVLVLLSRVGLRAGEVAGLTLDDLDWSAGEMVIRGKGSREERLPLPVDVGETIVGYLRDGRPRSAERALFLGVRAPHRAMTHGAVSAVVGEACRRAGVPPVGSHRLRHTVATELLSAGAGLSEVGQLLRHRSADTTVIYANVNVNALRRLAQPWPQVSL